MSSKQNLFKYEVYLNGVYLSTWRSDCADPQIVKRLILETEPELSPDIVVVLKKERKELIMCKDQVSKIKLTVEQVVNLNQALAFGLSSLKGQLTLLEEVCDKNEVMTQQQTKAVKAQIKFMEQTIEDINGANNDTAGT